MLHQAGTSVSSELLRGYPKGVTKNSRFCLPREKLRGSALPPGAIAILVLNVTEGCGGAMAFVGPAVCLGEWQLRPLAAQGCSGCPPLPVPAGPARGSSKHLPSLISGLPASPEGAGTAGGFAQPCPSPSGPNLWGHSPSLFSAAGTTGFYYGNSDRGGFIGTHRGPFCLTAQLLCHDPSANL